MENAYLSQGVEVDKVSSASELFGRGVCSLEYLTCTFSFVLYQIYIFSSNRFTFLLFYSILVCRYFLYHVMNKLYKCNTTIFLRLLRAYLIHATTKQSNSNNLITYHQRTQTQNIYNNHLG
jgi:hypothetical protein